MTFIIVCHTDHRPGGGQDAGYVVPGESEYREIAEETLASIRGLYALCDLAVEEVS